MQVVGLSRLQLKGYGLVLSMEALLMTVSHSHEKYHQEYKSLEYTSYRVHTVLYPCKHTPACTPKYCKQASTADASHFTAQVFTHLYASAHLLDYMIML